MTQGKKPAALHAENEALRSGYDASRLEIESLRARVQELGAMLRPKAVRWNDLLAVFEDRHG